MLLRTWATLIIYWSVTAANNCSRNDTAAATMDTTAESAVTAAGRIASSGHQIQSDSAWRAMLDTVRTSIGRDDAAGARALRSFAATARGEAPTTNEVAGSALMRSADELDTLAANIDAGRRPSPERVDSSLARLEHAESLNHLAKAIDAWAARRRLPASQELESAVNQLELAANDSRTTLDVQTVTAIANARWVASRLEDDVTIPTEELLRTVTALDDAVRGLGRRISR